MEKNLEDISLFTAIGGVDSLHRVVKAFYSKVLSDKDLARFFEGIDIMMLHGKMRAFLAAALGGPLKFTGKGLRESHSHLTSMGINELHYSLCVQYMTEALRENAVDTEIINQIATKMEDLKNQILNR